MYKLATVISFKDPYDKEYKMGEVKIFDDDNKNIIIFINAEGFSKPILSSHLHLSSFISYIYDMFKYESYILQYKCGMEFIEYQIFPRKNLNRFFLNDMLKKRAIEIIGKWAISDGTVTRYQDIPVGVKCSKCITGTDKDCPICHGANCEPEIKWYQLKKRLKKWLQ